MKVTIRKATQTDLGSILVLFDKLSLSDLPYDKDVDVNWAHTPDGKDYFIKKIEEINGVCFVAETGKKIVGYFTASKKEVPTYRLIIVADLENLVVDGKFRSQGIGKELVDSFTSWAKEIGAKRISVNIFSGNEKGMKFYKREGFLPFETILEKELNEPNV
ncbi:MAG: GNAT family N-acetyltransferase [bacterium]|nr:GNAT family N-acetyltransferase [bacterium]